MNFEVEAIKETNAKYKIFCYNTELAAKLNKLVRQYDYKFQSGDEAIFKLTEDQYKKSQKYLRNYR